MTGFIYLHGFASSPGSRKASVFRKRFEDRGLPLAVPDLEEGDFQHLTLSRQMTRVERFLGETPASGWGLIGSSMGGFLGVLLAQRHEKIRALYLMAPGFHFLQRWSRKIGFDPKHPEKSPDLIRVFHYRYNEYMDIHKNLFVDAGKWEALALDRPVPTRIVHGIHDETVPIAESRQFVQTRPWVQLQELDSDHDLISHVDWIVDDCIGFFAREKMI